MAELTDEEAWDHTERTLECDLQSFSAGTAYASDVLAQFVRDGGEPWDIYKIETAYLGTTLEKLVLTSDWETY